MIIAPAGCTAAPLAALDRLQENHIALCAYFRRKGAYAKADRHYAKAQAAAALAAALEAQA